MRSALLPILCCLWLVGTALPTRVLAQGAEETALAEVTALRVDLERIGDARGVVERQRDVLRAELEKLAGEIDHLKADRREGDLLPSFALDGKLRRSQELSESLTLLNRELDALDRVRSDKLQRLALAYDGALERATAAARKADPARRTQLGAIMARLRAERDEVRNSLLPDTPAPNGRPLDVESVLASDDPEELGEQADAVRDEQDRLRRRLASLDHRITELQSEQRLEREMRDFLKDQDLFGEHARTLPQPRSDAAINDQSGKTDDGRTGDIGLDGDYNSPPGGECAAGGCGTPADASGGFSTADTAAVTSPLPAGVGEDGQALVPGTAPATLGDLRQQRRALVEQLKRLQQAQDRIEEKIEALSGE